MSICIFIYCDRLFDFFLLIFLERNGGERDRGKDFNEAGPEEKPEMLQESILKVQLIIRNHTNATESDEMFIDQTRMLDNLCVLFEVSTTIDAWNS